LKRRKFIKHLEQNGCTTKEGAKHTRVFNSATRRWSTIPRHPEIDAMLVREICKQLGVQPPRER